MGFLDKAKAAAMDLQAKADTALGNSGLMGGSPMGAPGGSGSQGDRLLRDLGVLTYLNAVGTPGSADDYNRIMALLQQLAPAGSAQSQPDAAMGAPASPAASRCGQGLVCCGPGFRRPPPPGSAAPPPPPRWGFAPPPPLPPGGGFPPRGPDAAPGDAIRRRTGRRRRAGAEHRRRRAGGRRGRRRRRGDAAATPPSWA